MNAGGEGASPAWGHNGPCFFRNVPEAMGTLTGAIRALCCGAKPLVA